MYATLVMKKKGAERFEFVFYEKLTKIKVAVRSLDFGGEEKTPILTERDCQRPKEIFVALKCELT